MSQHPICATVLYQSMRGEGVIDVAGKRYFVAGAVAGDEGLFLLLDEGDQEDPRYGRAKLETLLKPSPDRRVSPCSHSGFTTGTCGGCSYMNISYEKQLQLKEEQLRHHLQRLNVGGSIAPIVAHPTPFGYRRRAQFKTDGEKIGFVSSGTQELVKIDQCLILHPILQQRLQQLNRQLPIKEFAATPPYPWHFFEMDVAEEGPIRLDKRLPFMQASSAPNAYYRDWLAAKLNAHDRSKALVELYAGSGNLTEVALQLGFTSIHAYEIQRSAIAIMQRRFGTSVQVYAKDLRRKGAFRSARFVPHILILNPPREGMQQRKEFFTTFKQALTHIYYISCHPESFAHDIKFMEKEGYEIESITPVDAFPQTPHMEILAALTKGS